MNCSWCGEPVTDAERHPQLSELHYACGIRSVIGSVAHIRRRCCCYVEGSFENDPPGMTRRQAANEALLAFAEESLAKDRRGCR